MSDKFPILLWLLLLTSSSGWAQSDAPYKGGVGDGYSMAELLVNASPTAISDDPESELKVYPSPLKKGQELIVKYSSSKKVNSIRLLDLKGNLLLEEKSNFSVQAPIELKIPTHHYPTGIYFLQLRNHKTTITKKIILL